MILPERPSVADCARIRRCRTGMLTLRMDGWLKVERGITTLEQVVKETGRQHLKADRCNAR